MIKINEKFKPLFEEKTRYYIITGDRGASKSFTVSLFLTYKLLQKNQNILFTRYTLVSAKDSIIPEFNEKIELLNITDNFNVNNTDIINESVNSSIKFRGIKTSQGIQTAKLKSLTNINIWVLDEAEELVDEKIFDKIDLSVRTKNSKNLVILMLNPTIRQHFIYKRFYENIVPDGFNGVKNNITYIHSTINDNLDNVDEELLNDLRQLKIDDPIKYSKKIAAGWLDEDDEIVFNYSKLKRFDKVDYSNSEIVAYCDVADQGNDYLCFIVAAIIGNNIFIIDVIHSDKGSVYTEPLIIQYIKEYKISTSLFESNNQGLMYTKSIKKDIKKKWRDSIIARPNSKNKHSRIVIQSRYILENFYFKKTDNKMYNQYLQHLTTYKNDKTTKIDDAPDATAGISKFIRTTI